MTNKVRLTIGEFSKFCRVTVKTLRHYEKLGLLRYIDSHGYKVSGLYRMQYVEGLHNQKNPEKWITIIQVPVTKDVETVYTVPNETDYL